VRIVLLGSAGMLGSKFSEILAQRKDQVLAPSLQELDLSEPLAIEEYFKKNDFDVVVNCAAYTAVDACEEPSQYSIALNVNGAAPGWLARFCKKTKRMLVHYSTDYVFDGEKEGFYHETDIPNPLNAYGRTKWQGERLVQTENPFYYLIRTSWLYGPHGRNFVKTIVNVLKTKPKAEVVSDQVGRPTYTGDLVRFTLELLEKKADQGLYHYANEGTASWCDFAREIQAQTGLENCKVVPSLTENVFRPAKRPANSKLDLSKSSAAVGHSSRPWQEALGEYLTKELPNETT